MCIERQTMRTTRTIRLLLVAWQARAEKRQARRAIDVSVDVAALSRAVDAWVEARCAAVRGRELALSARQCWEERLARKALHSWREQKRWQAHLQRLTPEVDAAVCRGVVRRTFMPWRKMVLWRLEVRRLGSVFQARQAEATVACRINAWRKIAQTAQRGALLAELLEARERGRRVAVWRKAAAVARLPDIRARLEARMLNDSVGMALRHLIGQHEALQTVASAFASSRPGVLQLLRSQLDSSAEDRCDAFAAWRRRARGRRQRLRKQTQLQARRQVRSKCLAVAAWDGFRACAAARSARRKLASQLRGLFDLTGLCRDAWLRWCSSMAGSKRSRQGSELALAADRRRALRQIWFAWARHAAARAAMSLAARKIDDAWASYAFRAILSAWNRRCRWQVAARLATMRFMAVQIRRHARHAFGHWLCVARALAALETRQSLQADDMRRRRRSMLCATVAAAWHEEALRSRNEAERACATKVLRCWQLYVQEQALLRRYLNQCSSANFTRFRGAAGSAGSNGGDVQPADFERLYEQMAALRWD